MTDNRVTIDFETRSHVPLKQTGVSIYAPDPSTQPICLAFKSPVMVKSDIWNANLFDDQIPGTREPKPPECIPALLQRAIDEGWEFHAYNAAFERWIWTHVMHKRWGWPQIPLEAWRCTAAKAAHASMPRALDLLTERLQLDRLGMAKDKEGHRLIGLLCSPRPAAQQKKRKLAGLSEYEEDKDLLAKFRNYCKQDVIAEEASDKRLPDFPEEELAVWRLDRTINERGFPIDRQLCIGAKEVFRVAVEKANVELTHITEKKVTAVTQVARIKKWVQSYPFDIGESLAEGQLIEILARKDVPDEVRRVLEIRQFAGSNNSTKYKSALVQVGPDDRVRESLLYYGAATGRWTGKGFHPHNFKRGAGASDSVVRALRTGSYDLVEQMSDKEGVRGVIDSLKLAVRSIIRAPKGRLLVVSDFSGIEARVLHWMARADRMLQLFRDKEDIYLAAACDIYKIAMADLTKDGKVRSEHKEKRQVGKQAQLGLGYGMGAPKFVENCKKVGTIITEEFSDVVVRAWREANPKVVRLWGMIERACFAAYREKKPKLCDRFVMGWHPRKYLTIQLPSGRKLFYFNPMLKEHTKWAGQLELTYITGEKKVAGVARIGTYGGKLVENVDQATSRDLLVNSMQIINRDLPAIDPTAGIIFHVHDEVVVECDEDQADDVKTLVHNAMETVPKWADGLPLAAETHVCAAYTK